MKKKKKLKKVKSKSFKKFKVLKLKNIIKVIERKKEFLFVFRKIDKNKVALDVLDYDSEDILDGYCFNSIQEVYNFIKINYYI